MLESSKIRRFKAYYVRTGVDTGIGITEHGAKWDSEVIGVHSIYSENNLSNRDVAVSIYQTIYHLLDDDEWAILRMSQASRGKPWHKAYENKIRIEKTAVERGSMYHAQLLAEDAIKRQATITEQFDEPFSFSVVQQEKEENSY